MQKFLLPILASILFFCSSAGAKVKYAGYVQKGGKVVSTTSITSYKLMETYPSATVTVYLTGTTTLASIFTNSSGTVKANPFTADSNAYFEFYVNSGIYDVKFSGTGITTPWTLSAIRLMDTIAWADVDKTVSSLADITTRNISDTTGTVPAARLPLEGVIDVVKTGGLKNDGVTATDGSITSGSTHFHSISKTCVLANVGEKFFAYGAGATNGTSGLPTALVTSITGCSGSDFILQNSAANNVASAGLFTYVSDSSSLLSTLIAANGAATFYFPAGIYMINAVTLGNNQYFYAAKNTVTIFTNSTSIFLASNRTGVTIDGFIFEAGGYTLGNGAMTLNGGTIMTDVTFKNNTYKDSYLYNNVSTAATFNRHGILARNWTNLKILNCDFYNGLRIKAAGSVQEINGDIGFINLNDTNENGISLLSADATEIIRNVTIHDIKINNIMASGNGITIGDDGGGVTQQNINIFVTNVICKGTFPSNTACIQNRGAFLQKGIHFNYVHFTNDSTTGSNVFAINNAQQTGVGTPIIDFEAIGNTSTGRCNNACFRFSGIANGIIANNYVNANGQAADRGIKISTATNLQVTGNYVLGATFGYDIDSWNGGTFSNNTALNSTNAGTNITSSATNTSSFIATGNTMKGSTLDGFTMDPNGGTISIDFIGNEVTNNGNYGFDEVTTTLITNNYYWNVAKNNGIKNHRRTTSTSLMFRSVCTFQDLGTPANGSEVYCTDCNSTCTASGGTGKKCFRDNGAWAH